MVHFFSVPELLVFLYGEEIIFEKKIMTDPHPFFIENEISCTTWEEVGDLLPHDVKWWQALKYVLKEGNAK